ncbi:hypothetical protein MMC17_000219 [Xylographa soralifera]|nr:hypothetical protein [Xylographa soralifera]
MPSASAQHPTHASPSRPHPPLPNELLLLAESQWLFTEEELLLTPSILAGLSPAKERESRGKGVNFILQVGIMLKLPQITLATASVFLHRFFMRHSMVEDKAAGKPANHYYSVAATCLFLATKVEENCRKMKDLVVACVRVAQKNPGKVVDEQDKEYWRWRDTILHMEDILLEAVCFDLSLEPPYKTLFELLCFFGEENNKRLRNAAWAFVNDSCLTMLCLLFSSRAIAASALYAAARHCEVRFLDDADGRPWWEIVGVELRSIRRACNYMAGIYENTPLRNGGDGGSIYERTPEDGDEWVAKTRERREEREGSRGRGRSEGLEESFKREREVSTGASVTGSDGERKRRREEIDDIPWGGDVKDEREEKRIKVEPNGTTNGVEHGNRVEVKVEEMSDANGSEEGEVEP